MTLVIRPTQPTDRERWDALWQGYLVFYQTQITDAQTNLTWQRMMDPDFGIHGLVAEADGELVGFAHYSYSLSTWEVNPDLYLEDLYVDPSVRGKGVGRALITALDDIAIAKGSRMVYWQTHDDNATARRLYDTMAKLSKYVKYERMMEQ